MKRPETYAELEDTPRDKLVRLFDDKGGEYAWLKPDFIRNEIARRDAERDRREIASMTRTMRNLTVLIAVLTAINVLLAFVLVKS